jgi:hypothetical protein
MGVLAKKLAICFGIGVTAGLAMEILFQRSGYGIDKS